MSGKYDDIINLPHHVSKTRPRMSAVGRAAQFSPFAALVGYDSAIRETARLTDERPEHSEEAKHLIDKKLKFLADRISLHPSLTVTYFVPDCRKEGGAYRTIRENLKKVDPFDYMLILADGTKIPFEDIFAIESEIFQKESG